MDSKSYFKLIEKMLDTAFIGYRVQQGLYTILGKTYKTGKTCLYNSVRNSSENQLIHLPSLREQAFAFLCIVILMQRKI